MRWLRQWWERKGWRPDADETRAKDRQVEQLRSDAIHARQDRERATLVVVGRVRVMRETLDAVAAYRAAEQARMARRS